MPRFAKREIKKSFIKLLNERPISQITVKEIVEDCGVNRNSFYYHFQDIPSLLKEITEEVTDSVLTSLPEDCSIEEKVVSMLRIFTENKKVVYNIFSSTDKQVYEHEVMMICDYVTRSYISSREYSRYVSDDNREFIISFLKCEMYGQVIDWLTHNMSYNLIDHSRRLCRMFAGTITAVCEKNRIENK